MICERNKCTGCGMCTNICPKNAIKMERDECGFYYPKINEERCITCTMCRKKCPANAEGNKESSITSVYACWNKNKKIRKKSTSGGVFTLLAQNVIKAGGAVVGVRWDESFQPIHTIVENEQDIELLRGSKYVQSKTEDIYNKVKVLLDARRQVLFSGTPCQNAALRSFLGKDYDKLICIDLICHGVPPYDLFKRYLAERAKGREIKNIVLRNKNPYWDYSEVKIEFSDNSKYEKDTIDDSYFTLFNFGYSLRSSCHDCQYTNLARWGDLTLADFWGYKPTTGKMLDYNKGISLVFTNTKKGENIFNSIKEKLNYEESTIEKAKGGAKMSL